MSVVSRDRHSLLSPAATAASLASLEAIRQRVTELHLEQLLQRERPFGRTEQGWQNILSAAQDSVVARLEKLNTPEAVWDFAHRCLKDTHLKEVFRSFAVDDVCDCAISAESVRSAVFPEEEHNRFSKDLEAYEFLFRVASFRICNQRLRSRWTWTSLTAAFLFGCSAAIRRLSLIDFFLLDCSNNGDSK